MTDEAILEFVGKTFRSAWTLELLLAFRQEARNVGELVRELRASTAAITQSLTELRQTGFISMDPEGAHRFDPGSPELSELAGALSDLHSRKPRAIMRVILAAPNDRIPIFANAFRLRKDND